VSRRRRALTRAGAGLLVLEEDAKAAACKAAAALGVELFTVAELQVDVTNHPRYYPHVVVADPAEYARHGPKDGFPRLAASERQARYIGAKKGQVVKVVGRWSPTAGEETVFKLVA
jgi:DNA-directed RNA polymerase subunit H (RpoH/RPB5)